MEISRNDTDKNKLWQFHISILTIFELLITTSLGSKWFRLPLTTFQSTCIFRLIKWPINPVHNETPSPLEKHINRLTR